MWEGKHEYYWTQCCPEVFVTDAKSHLEYIAIFYCLHGGMGETTSQSFSSIIRACDVVL